VTSRKQDQGNDRVVRDAISVLETPAAGEAGSLPADRAAAALPQSEVPYRDLFEKLGLAVAVYEAVADGEDFVVRDLNQAGERIEKINREDVVGRRVTQVLPGVKEFGLFAVFQRVWRTGQAEHFPVAFYRDDRIDGWRDNFVYKLPGGEIVAVYQDRTEGKRPQERLERLSRLKEDLLVPGPLDQKMKRITDELVEVLGADFARVWIIRACDLCDTGCLHAEQTEGPHVCRHRSQCLHLAASSGRYTHTDGEVHRRVPFGCYKIGRVAAAADPGFVTNEVTRDPRVHNQDWARELGLVSFAGYRLLSTDGKPVGVLALFSREKLTGQDESLLTAIANTASPVIQTALSEEALRTSERRYAGLFEDSPVPIWELDLSAAINSLGSGADRSEESFESYLSSHPQILEESADLFRIVDLNQALIELFEAPDKETVKRDISRFLTPEGVRTFVSCLGMILSGRPLVQRDTSVRTATGKRREVTLRVGVPAGSDERPSRVLVSLSDITERKRAEEERQRLATAIEQAAESIVITDRKGLIQYVNPAFEKISGYSRAEAEGRTPRFLKSGKHGPEFYHQMWSKLTAGEVWQGRLVNRHKDGTRFEEEATISPVRDASGEVTHYVAVKHDLSQVTRLESQLRQAQKMEAIGTLAGGIAHDFNNILYAILGYTQLAIDDVEEDSSVHASLAEVLRAGDRASQLVRQMLTFSRRTEQERSPLLLGPVVKEAMKLLHGSLPATISISERIDSACGEVMADPTQIHQVIMNLCTNAFQTMREKGGTLEVNLSEVSISSDQEMSRLDLERGRYAKISVSDTGPGIDAAILDRIFEPYFSTRSPQEGTGLGLAIVHGIVKDHGGGIAVASEVGQGTTFTVYLPLCATPDRVSRVGATEAEGTGDEGRILLVDDEEMVRKMGKTSLERLGFEVTACGDGAEALAAFRSAPRQFDAVVTDQTMPGITGMEVAKEMLKIRPDIPVILTTGFSEVTDEEQVRAAGIAGFLQKPVDISNLAATIRRARSHAPGGGDGQGD